MAPIYKLKYFNYMGLAEPIRYLLAYGNIQYENIVISDAEWIKMQKLVPFGKLPLLEVDNKVLWNSLAISQYLGQLVGLWPLEDLDVAEMNAIAQRIYELGSKMLNWNLETNLEWKEAMWKKLEEIIIPKYLGDLEEILKKKGTFFGGKKINWVDLYFVGILDFIELLLNKNLLQKQWPALNQLSLEVRNVPAIKLYISKRPTYKY